MGDRQIQVTPDQAITVSDLQPYHPLPALMMPPLEASALPRLAFILALTWDQVHDAGDLAEGMANRLTVALFREQVVSSESLWPKQANVIVVQRDGTGQTAVDQAVNRMLAQALFKQAAAEWWAGVQPYFAAESVTLSANDAKAVIYQIESWILRLDQLAYNRYPNDLMRIIVHVVGWLAKVDFPLCIATLQQWLANADPQQRLVGAACGRFLFTLFMASKPPPDPYAQLLQVVPLLGQQNWDAAQTILQTAYRLSDDPAWRQRLLLQPSGAAGELMMMIDQTAATYHKPMTQLFERWTVAQSVADKEENKTARSGFVEQLRLRLALSSRQPLPGLLAESVYGLIVVDLAVRHGKKRRRLANMAAKIIEQLTAKLQQRPRSGFQLLTYWLGRDHPVAGPGEKPIAEQLMPTNGTTHPRLLGPLLERFTPQQIGFVFIVSDELPHDVEDWRNTELQRRLLLYADEPHSDWAAMCTVLSREDEEEDKTIGTITSYLLQRAGG
jgi:hypothetical protein